MNRSAAQLSEIAAVLFDLDGTLVDSAPDLAYALNAQRRLCGQPELPLSALRPYVSEGARGMLNAGLGVRPSDPQYAELREQFLQIYAENLCRESRLFPGMEQVLLQLEACGIKWGIVTNKHTAYTTPLVAALGIRERAACVICGDTTAHAKPHPAPLLEASAQMGIEVSGCAYVGDDERDVQASLAAGMVPVVALYGYLGVYKAPQEWGAQLYISAPIDLLNLLGRPLSMG
jgi:N-acetyl-D-muramate 6-phosphate phosphatase